MGYFACLHTFYKYIIRYKVLVLVLIFQTLVIYFIMSREFDQKDVYCQELGGIPTNVQWTRDHKLARARISPMVLVFRTETTTVIFDWLKL